MPLLQGTELEDGRYLGLTVREVTALPHVDVFGFLSAMEAVLTQKGCSLSGGEALTGLLEQAEGQLHALVRQEKVPMSFIKRLSLS